MKLSKEGALKDRAGLMKETYTTLNKHLRDLDHIKALEGIAWWKQFDKGQPWQLLGWYRSQCEEVQHWNWGSEGCFESFKELVLDLVLRATYGNEGLYLLTISPWVPGLPLIKFRWMTLRVKYTSRILWSLGAATFSIGFLFLMFGFQGFYCCCLRFFSILGKAQGLKFGGTYRWHMVDRPGGFNYAARLVPYQI